MPMPIHFEIPAEDLDRATHFYNGVFGWNIQPARGIDHWMIRADDAEADPIPSGGITIRQSPGQQICHYIRVSSVEETLNRIKALGGTVLADKTAVPGIGFYAICLDSEENRFGIVEAHVSEGE